jgi:hypothetical protein
MGAVGHMAAVWAAKPDEFFVEVVQPPKTEGARAKVVDVKPVQSAMQIRMTERSRPLENLNVP